MELPSGLHRLSLCFFYYYNILLFILAAWGLSYIMGGLCCSTWVPKCVGLAALWRAQIKPNQSNWSNWDQPNQPCIEGRFLTTGSRQRSPSMLLFLLCERELNFHLMEVIDLLASLFTDKTVPDYIHV